MKKLLIYISVIVGLILTGCRNERLSDDPSLRLTFSMDTLRFDTVFTGVGTATLTAMLRNENGFALKLDRVWQDAADGRRAFYVNVDGETDLSRLTSTTLSGGDSLYIFVRVQVDPTSADAPLLLEDALHIAANGHTATLHLEAYGQNVHLIRTASHTLDTTDFCFLSDRPYLIFDTLLLHGHTRMEAGAKLYFHHATRMEIWDRWEVAATPDRPVTLIGDRTDRLFEHVPYSFSAGAWQGVRIHSGATVQLQHVDILSAENGLMADTATVTLENCRIHNHSGLGVALFGCESRIRNCEFSNAAAFLLYLAAGRCEVDHTTLASYFNHTNVRIQSVDRQDVPALYLDSVAGVWPTLTVSNSIVTGVRYSQVESSDSTFVPDFHHCYLSGDTLSGDLAHDNVYRQNTDTVFVNDFYRYQVYAPYDFHLSERSPARGIDEASANVGCYPE